MAGGTSGAILRDIQTLFDIGTVGGLTDRQLLERFAARRDASSEAAFEVLVLRHGPMVLRVCRNVLRDRADADDAFQATFLVLVRRSDSIRQLDSVGGWLYGVACRVAARARVEAGRRRTVEDRAAARIVEAVDPNGDDGPAGLGLGPVVQEEVRRLPERYRAVVALCYWEGLTHEQAAAQLGCPLGTVRSRMARARKILHRRLTRRGLAPLAGVVAASFDSASAAMVASRLSSVSNELIQTTVRAAGQVAAGKMTAQVATNAVALLVERVIWSTTMIKISSVATGLVLLGLTGYGVGLAGQRAGELPPVPRLAQIDGNLARQNGGRGRAQPGAGQKSAQGKRALKAAGDGKIYALVEGTTSIISLVPDGSTVKKGDIVCELDSAALKDQLINQRITTESASASWQNANLAREVAEIAVVEYLEGTFPSELADFDGEIKLAEMEMSLAEDELKAAAAGGGNSSLAVKRAELAKLRGAVALKKAQSRRRLLVEYTKGKTIKELEKEVRKAASNELAKKATWDLEREREKKLERQIAACTINAPRDGTVVYAAARTQPVMRKDGTTALIHIEIEEGAQVRERQLLFEIVPTLEAKPN